MASELVERLEGRCLLSATAMLARPASVGGGGGMVASPAFVAGNAGVVGYSPAQARSAYGINSIRFGSVVGDGTGQTIAIVSAYNNPAFVNSTDPLFGNSDLAKFDAVFGIANPPSFTKIDQNGSTTALPVNDPTGGYWANETALDVEWAHAIAPAAKILLVSCYSDGLNDLIQGGVQTARNYPGVSVVSMSFAADEAASEVQYDSYFTTPAGHQGVTFVAAAGDNGAPAQYPSASPNVVSVGGTTVTLSGSSYSSETGLANGGGGASAYEPKPIYQFGVTQSSTKRTTPDVSFAANHDSTGFAVYDSFNGGTSAPWYAIGGTSFSTPVWSALIATANQGRGRLGLPSLDSATQTLPRLYYLNASDFHDVSSGNNGAAAGSGYDLVTGRGSPRANTLVPNLAGGASISGIEFQDSNRNGTQDSGDAALAGVGVYLDLYSNGRPSGADPSVNTDANGGFGIGDLPGGTYKLASVGLTSYTKTTAATQTITVGYGQSASGQKIGQHFDTGTVAGYVFEDLDNSRTRASSEPAYAGWTVYLDNNADGKNDAGDTVATSDKTGYYSFKTLALGQVYHVRQDIPAGYSRTTLGYGQSADVALYGGTSTVNLGYVPNSSSIAGTLFYDANSNGKQDAGETGLSGVQIYLDLNRDGSFTPGVDLPTYTTAGGAYTIGGLAPATYVVNQVLPPYYRPTRVAVSGIPVSVAVDKAVTGQNFADIDSRA